MCNGNGSLQAKIGWIDDLVSPRVEHHRLSMHPSLVGKARFTRNVIIEGDLDADDICNHFVEVIKHLEFVFPHEILVIGIKASDEATQWCNAIPFSNAQNTRVNVCGAGLQSGKAVSDGAPAIVMAVKFDSGFDVTPQ